jgi:hypothetical protein
MVDNLAPEPMSPTTNIVPINSAEANPNISNPSVTKVTIAACGGCGMNLGRIFAGERDSVTLLNFDTSTTNGRKGEQIYVFGEGAGSGSLRSENAREIERKITSLSKEEMGGDGDVAVVIYSLAGGSGSVIGPLLTREYARQFNMRVICVVVADSSSATGAKNTLNTLKTLTQISTNMDLYIPLIMLSNDQPGGRSAADREATTILTDLIDLLTTPVYEVDRNDRMNWVNPSKVVNTKPGLKLMHLVSDNSSTDASVVVGVDSDEMVDSLLITQTPDEESLHGVVLPPARLKKVGFYGKPNRAIAGKVTSDIKAIDKIIDQVDRMQQIDKSQRTEQLGRLTANSGGDDLIL